MGERKADPAPLAAAVSGDDAGLSAFFIVADTIRRGDADLVRRSIVEKGFEVLLELEITGTRRDKLAQWLTCRGPSVESSDVSVLLIAHDLLPIASPNGDGAHRPAERNARNEVATSAARREVNRSVVRRRRYVPVFASESSADAWSLLQAFAPERTDAIRKDILKRHLEFATPAPLRELSSVACRAKVELIEYQGSPAVRKTFRPGAQRYLERELAVFRQLGPHCEAIPKLLEHGPNHLVMEYIDEADQLGLPRGESLWPLPLTLVRQLADFVRTCVARGFDPVDLKPDGNAIYTKRGLKVIDYEFWQRCPIGTRPEDSCCLAGLPEDFAGDRPIGLVAPFRPYPMKWRIFTGLPVRSFLYDPAWLQRLKRVPWPAIATVRRAAQLASRLLRPRDR